MTPRLLVVTSVHPADDPRIREKHIRTLSSVFDVTYASKAPGPSDRSGLDWHLLPGGRVRRWVSALRLMLTSQTDLIAIHDPELVPAGITARVARRIPVVFDVHEDVPAQFHTKQTVPQWLRRPLSLASRLLLSWADRSLVVTLAEDGYDRLFRSRPPVFPNYLDGMRLPESGRESRLGVVYVGDITEQRGALTLLEAAARSGRGPVTYVGRCSDTLRLRLLERAADYGVDIELPGWLPHPEAMVIAGQAEVGVSPLHDTPNYRYSLPTKTLEYLAMGTPVIASDLPGTTRVIGSLPGVRLVPAGDIGALAEALASVGDGLGSDAILGSDHVRRRFQWPASEVRAFYRSLVEG